MAIRDYPGGPDFDDTQGVAPSESTSAQVSALVSEAKGTAINISTSLTPKIAAANASASSALAVAQAAEAKAGEAEASSTESALSAREAAAQVIAAAKDMAAAEAAAVDAGMTAEEARRLAEATASASGLGPSTPEDGQTAALIQQTTTLTRAAAQAASLQAVSSRVGPTRVDVVQVASSLDSAGIQAVIDAHGPGTEFYFSAEKGDIILDAQALVPSAPGQKFVHERGLTIRQPNLYHPAYDILHDDITVHDLTAVGPDSRPTSGVAWRGSSTANYGAAIWTAGQRTRVTGRLRSTNFKIGVNFAAYDPATEVWLSKSKRGNYLEDAEIVGADFGVLAVGQDGLSIGRITTRDHVDSSGGTDPNHAVYIVGKNSGTVRNADVQIGEIRCTGLTFGQVLQVKETDGLTVGAVIASECATLLNLQDIHDWSIGQVVHRATAKPAGGAMPLVWTQSPTCTRGHIGSILVDDSGDAAASTSVVRLAADDCKVGMIHTTTHRVSATGNPDIILTGKRAAVSSLHTVAAGGAAPSLMVGHSSSPAEDVTVTSHTSHGASKVADFTAYSTGTAYTHNASQHRAGTYTGSGITRTGDVTVSGSHADPATPLVITANRTLTPEDDVVIADGAALVYLPTIPEPVTGKRYTVKNVAASPMSVRSQGGGNIDGNAAVTLNQWSQTTALYDGSRWITI